jgi:hypothetical protein
LTNWTPHTPAPPAAGTIPITRLAGRSTMFATASARPPQYQLDQGPGRAEHRDPEIPLRHHADIRPLELDVSHEGDGDRAGCGEITLETGENPFECAQAAGQQTVRVAILRRARTRSGGCWQAVTLDDLNLLKIFGQSAGGRKPANSGANDNCPLTQLARAAAIPRR